MDPDANLQEQRRIAERLLDDNQRHDPYHREQDALRLAELVQALDEWITKGGFLPPSWGKHWRGVRS
jgi:hypothetical protein